MFRLAENDPEVENVFGHDFAARLRARETVSQLQPLGHGGFEADGILTAARKVGTISRYS